MSGVAVIRARLAADGSLTSVVPAARIVAGDLSLQTAMPSIIVTQISGMPLNFIRNAGHKQAHTDRVQVTAMATTYPVVKQLMALILAACSSTKGTVGGVTCLDIVPDFQGPDFADQALALYSQSRDFLVRWTT